MRIFQRLRIAHGIDLSAGVSCSFHKNIRGYEFEFRSEVGDESVEAVVVGAVICYFGRDLRAVSGTLLVVYEGARI